MLQKIIKSITVEELYGEFTHKIDIKEGNITLVLGENGLGKTIVLKMIKFLFDNELYELGNYEFKRFIITFQDNSFIEIYKEVKESKRSFRYEDYILHFEYNTASLIDIKEKKENKKELKKSSQKFSLKSDDLIGHFRNDRRNSSYRRNINHRINHAIRNFIPRTIDNIGPDKWYDLNSGVMYSTQDLIERYSEYFPEEILEELKIKEIPDWFIDLTKSINIKLVETQRLLTKINSEEKEYKNAVIQYANQLKEIIKIKALEATNLSTKLDRTYTNRLIEKITSTNTTPNNSIDQSLKDLETRRLFLIKVGLLEHDDEAILPINLNKEYANNDTLRDVLDIYIEDSNEKLSVYKQLSEKLNTLIDIINKRFTYKEFYVNKNEGFIFQSTKTNKVIPLTNLSSGEQHELVLFYELLFNTPKDSLILIDEPEISLHISWQNEFINDLKEVSELINLKSIIATHSPDIINNNWDLTIEL